MQAPRATSGSFGVSKATRGPGVSGLRGSLLLLVSTFRLNLSLLDPQATHKPVLHTHSILQTISEPAKPINYCTNHSKQYQQFYLLNHLMYILKFDPTRHRVGMSWGQASNESCGKCCLGLPHLSHEINEVLQLHPDDHTGFI